MVVLTSQVGNTACITQLEIEWSRNIGPWALLANIPTPLNFQLGYTDTVKYGKVQ